MKYAGYIFNGHFSGKRRANNNDIWGVIKTECNLYFFFSHWKAFGALRMFYGPCLFTPVKTADYAVPGMANY